MLNLNPFMVGFFSAIGLLIAIAVIASIAYFLHIRSKCRSMDIVSLQAYISTLDTDSTARMIAIDELRARGGWKC